MVSSLENGAVSKDGLVQIMDNYININKIKREKNMLCNMYSNSWF